MARLKYRHSFIVCEDIPDATIVFLANLATNERDRFISLALQSPAEQCEQVRSTSSKLYSRRFEHRPILWALKTALKQVARIREGKAEPSNARIERESLWQRSRGASALLALKHPKGRIIGSTPVVDFKSPGVKKHWATRRRRRP